MCPSDDTFRLPSGEVTATARSNPWPGSLFASCLALALGLSGCGSGSGSGDSADPQTSPQVPSRYFAGLAGGLQSPTLAVWDPTRPQASRQLYGGASQPVMLVEQAFDAQKNTQTHLGPARVFYLRNGGLQTIDLRAGQVSHAEQSITDAGAVCALLSADSLDASANTVAVVTQAPATDGSGDCAVSKQLMVWRAGGALQRIDLIDETLMQVLWRPDGSVAGLLTHRRLSGGGTWPSIRQVTDLAAVSWLGTPDDNVTIQSQYIGADPSQPGSGALQIAGQLHLLDWSGTSIRLGERLGSIDSSEPVVAAADSSGLYFADGTTIYRLASASVQSLGQLNVADENAPDWVHQILTGSNSLFVQTLSGFGTTSIQSLSKTGAGSARTLLKYYRVGSYSAMTPYMTAAQADSVVVISGQFMSGRENRFANRYPASGDPVVAEVGYPIGHIQAATWPWGASPKINAMLMVHDAQVRRWDMDSGLRVDFAPLPNAEYTYGDWWLTFENQAAALRLHNPSGTIDMWSLTTAAQPTLTRVTTEGQ